MKLYKSLTKDNKGPYSGFDFTPYLPESKFPGKWTHKVKKLKICASGYHGCEGGDILDYPNANIYEIEVRGKILKGGNKFAAEQIRFLQKCEGWNERTMRLYACDCAERVLPIFEKEYPGDDRPRNAIETARRYADGKATDEELKVASHAARVAYAYTCITRPAYAAYAAAHTTDTVADTAVLIAACAGRDAVSDDSEEQKWQKRQLLKLLK